MKLYYEYHQFANDESLKVIYHRDIIRQSGAKFLIHFHENIELLLIREGKMQFTVDQHQETVCPGELAIVPPNGLHNIDAVTDFCSYDCLIFDRSLYRDLFPDTLLLPSKTDHPNIIAFYDRIITLLNRSEAYAEQEIKGLIPVLLSLLCRQAAEEGCPQQTAGNNKRMNMIRAAITYLNQHYTEDLSVDLLCKEIGFSKYYFCRSFKEITGHTPIWHLNYIRCRSARFLLRTEPISIAECSGRCGFNNPSYFCKTYKKYYGHQPRQDQKVTKS